jgi:hypothetical protein
MMEDLLLHDEDFPRNYVHMAHPDDYKTFDKPILPEFICHTYYGRHDRLIVRASWKVSDNAYVPMSFVCDTGAPSHMYLSPKALQTLSDNSLIIPNDIGISYVKVHKNTQNTFPAPIEDTPYAHKNANILGLKCLKRLNLKLNENSFGFNDEFIYF